MVLEDIISNGASYHHPVVDIHFLNAAKHHVSHSNTFNIYKFLQEGGKRKAIISQEVIYAIYLSRITLARHKILMSQIPSILTRVKWSTSTYRCEKRLRGWEHFCPTLMTLPSGS
jgi:hypothetical protein